MRMTEVSRLPSPAMPMRLMNPSPNTEPVRSAVLFSTSNRTQVLPAPGTLGIAVRCVWARR